MAFHSAILAKQHSGEPMGGELYGAKKPCVRWRLQPRTDIHINAVGGICGLHVSAPAQTSALSRTNSALFTRSSKGFLHEFANFPSPFSVTTCEDGNATTACHPHSSVLLRGALFDPCHMPWRIGIPRSESTCSAAPVSRSHCRPVRCNFAMNSSAKASSSVG
jgi:hypothetical protein